MEPEPLAIWAISPTTRMLLAKVRAFITALKGRLAEALEHFSMTGGDLLFVVEEGGENQLFC